MKKNRSALRWIAAVSGHARRWIALLAVLQVLLALIALWYAPLFRRLIDAATGRDLHALRASAVGFAAVLAAQLLLRAASRYLEEDCRAKIENACKAHLFRMILRKQYAPVAAVHTGEWMNRLTADTRLVADDAVQILPGAAGMAVRMVGALALLVVYELRFLVVLIPGGLILIGATFLFRRRLKALHSAIREKDGALSVFLQERVEHLMLVRAFGRESAAQEREAELAAEHRTARLRRIRFSNLCNSGFSLAAGGAYVLSGIYCAWRIYQGAMSYGMLTAILQLVSQVQTPFAGISGFVPRYYAMLASAERLMQIEAAQDEQTQPPLTQEQILACSRSRLQAIRLSQISFSYAGGKKAVSGCSLRFAKGEFTAVTGASGCGKSTLLRLLMCFYPIESGERMLELTDGDVPLTPAWRGLFAYVPQGNQLMSGTIREAVTFYNRAPNEAQIRRALHVACADTFVDALPKGLDTMLGEKGTGLSEGQLQRLAIARAIYSGRPVLLLDEATSALDEQTEAEVLRRLRAESEQTVLIVTHRRAALAIVDKIVSCRSDGERWSWQMQEP